MTRWFLPLALIATPATAQVVSAPPSVVDQAARDAAAAAQTVASSACQPMAAVPPLEIPGGTAGSGQNCRLVNAADNRISRTGQFTVNTSGAILCGGSTTCTWSTPLPAGAASYPVFFTPIGAAGTASVRCKVASSTNTGFTGATCVQATVSIVLGGLVETSVFQSAAQVYALSLPATQVNQ